MSAFKVGDRVRVLDAFGHSNLAGKRGTVIPPGPRVREGEVSVMVDGDAQRYFYGRDLAPAKPKRKHSRKQVVAELRRRVAAIEALETATYGDSGRIMAYEVAIDLLMDVED